MRPICVKCKREMEPTQNEVLVKDKAVGRFGSTYRYGDKFQCPECGAEIIAGLGSPLMENDFYPAAREKAIEFTRG